MTKISDRKPDCGVVSQQWREVKEGGEPACVSSWGTDLWYRRPVRLRKSLVASPYEATRTVYRK